MSHHAGKGLHPGVLAALAEGGITEAHAEEVAERAVRQP
jgi:hypothetical protein